MSAVRLEKKRHEIFYKTDGLGGGAIVLANDASEFGAAADLAFGHWYEFDRRAP